MTMACPPIVRSVVIAEDARLAAQISCALAVSGHYLPVIEGPRLLHPDPIAELVRRNNAAGRVRPDSIFLAALSHRSYEVFMARFTDRLKARARRISTVEEIEPFADPARLEETPLTWGTDRIGVGLLKALRARRRIVFTDEPSPAESIPSQSGHLVVCEQGEVLAEVIAANYAYALRAGLFLIPEISRDVSDELMERFYSLYEDRAVSPTDV